MCCHFPAVQLERICLRSFAVHTKDGRQTDALSLLSDFEYAGEAQWSRFDISTLMPRQITGRRSYQGGVTLSRPDKPFIRSCPWYQLTPDRAECPGLSHRSLLLTMSWRKLPRVTTGQALSVSMQWLLPYMVYLLHCRSQKSYCR